MQFDSRWFVVSLGGVLFLLRILSQVEWWQRKEYRWDRIRSQLYPSEGRGLLAPLLLVALVLLVGGWLGEALSWPAAVVTGGWASLALLLSYDIRWIIRRGVRRPTATVKASVLFLVVLIVTVVIAGFWLKFDQTVALRLATIAAAIPLITGLSTMAINIPFRLRAQSIIADAFKRRRQYSRMTAVGITGSYGKTSTKFFLQQLVADDPAIAVSADHRNSPLAIAQDMLRQLKPAIRAYIVEMGAYRQGEIRELTQLVVPQIGIITAIGNQHVALFGSIETLAATKWELIDNLPATGVAVLNADDPQQVARAKNIPQRIIWYSLEPKKTELPLSVFVTHISVKSLAVEITLHINDEERAIVIPLVSQALLASAIAAAAGALAMGTPVATIFRLLQTLRPFPRTMAYHVNSHGVHIIDDSYSGNERGTLLAIEHLRFFPEAKKVIVFTPLIELGREGKAVHEKIGAALAASGATILLTNSTHHAAIIRGGKKVDATFAPACLTVAYQLSNRLQIEATSGSVVLLEGRLPEIVRRKVIA